MAETAKLLLVDDDPEIREVARVLLESEGFQVAEAASGEEALQIFTPDVDLLILDVMMQGLSGYQVCAQIREHWNVPILFLTAKTRDADLMTGYCAGGDDYLTKPFSYIELLARVKGLLRRYQIYKGKSDVQLGQYVEWRGLRLNRKHNQVWKGGKELNLTTTEYQILRLLMTCRGKTFSAQSLYESVWEEAYLSSSSNTVMVHIRKLREKIESNPQEPELLKTVWGKGYRIE